MFRDQFKVLQSGFVARVLVLRAALLVLCVHALDTFQAAVAARGAATDGDSGAWGWPGRLAMAGLQLPLLLNLWGLLWPVFHPSSFEKHHTKWHRGLVWGAIVGKVLEQLSGWVGGSSCSQALLFHGFLFVFHQDPAYVTHGLAPMVVAYSLTDAWCVHLTRSFTSSSMQVEQLTTAEQLMQATKHAEYYMHCITSIVMVHQLFNRLAGAPKQARPAQAAAAGAFRGLAPPSNPLSMRSSSATRLTSTSSARSSTSSDSCSGRGSSGAGQAGGPARLSHGYVVKLALVKMCDAMFTAILVWQLVTDSSQRKVPSITSSSSIWGAQGSWLTSSQLLAVHAATQGLHAVLCMLQPAWLQKHLTTVNRMSFCSAVGTHVSLLLAVVAGQSSGAASGYANLSKAWPQVAFRSFTMLAPSLMVHEAPWQEMAVELIAGAAIYRWLHLQLLVLSGTAADSSWSITGLPEYPLIIFTYLLTYPMLCLGREDQGWAGSTAQCSLRRTRSSSLARASVADSVGAAEVAAACMGPCAAPGRPSIDLGALQVHPSKPKMHLNVVVPVAQSGLSQPWEAPEDSGSSSHSKGLPPLSPSRMRQQVQAGRSMLSRMSLGGADTPQVAQEVAPAASASAYRAWATSIGTGLRQAWQAAQTAGAACAGQLWVSAWLQVRPAGAATGPSTAPGDNTSDQGAGDGAATGNTWLSWLENNISTGRGQLQYSFSRTGPIRSSLERSDMSGSANSSPRHAHTPAAGGAADEAQVAFMQRVAIDVACVVMSLPIGFTLSPMVYKEVFNPQQPLDLLARFLAFLCATYYLVTYIAHTVVRCWHPRRTAPSREAWWMAGLLWGPTVLQVGIYLVRQKPLWDPLVNLNIVAVGSGIIRISPRHVGRWLPLVCTTFFGLQAIEKWSTTQGSKLLVEALEYLLLPSTIYGVMWVIYTPLHNMAWRLVYLVMVKLGGERVSNKPVRWMMAAAIIGHQLVASVTMWVPLLAPALPDAWNPVMLLETAKASLSGMVDRLDLNAGAAMDTMQTLAAVLAIGLCFLAVSSLQAIILASSAFRNPRQAWYEAAKGRVAGLGEATMSALQGLEEHAGPAELQQALIDTLRGLVTDCFAGSTMLLVLPEQEHDLEGPAVQRRLLLADSGIGFEDVPEQETLLPEALPSVVAAFEQGCKLYQAGVQPHNAEYEDWADLAAAHGVDSIMVVPLSCAGGFLGSLVLVARLPAVLDAHLQRLASDLGHALSQTLYTLACIGQMRAGEQIIQDIMPQKVAEQLRKRLVTHSSGSGLDSPSTPRGHSPTGFGSAFEQLQDSHHPPLLSRLSAAPVTPKEQQMLQQQHGQEQEGEQLESSPNGSFRRGSVHAGQRSSLPGNDYDVPVVYKQWHSAVTVLFADISSYTAMSTQVEPEEVMLLLHELFSKYDHLCKRFGIYKVETIGDCYMACSGLLVDNPDHAQHMVQFAKAMLGAAASVRNPLGGSVHIRVGVHSGRVMSGIVGSIRARYCLFGDTVNTASRMESTGVVDRIQVTDDTYSLLGNLQQDFELREAVSVKGKGVMQTYLLTEQVAAECQASFGL